MAVGCTVTLAGGSSGPSRDVLAPATWMPFNGVLLCHSAAAAELLMSWAACGSACTVQPCAQLGQMLPCHNAHGVPARARAVAGKGFIVIIMLPFQIA